MSRTRAFTVAILSLFTAFATLAAEVSPPTARPAQQSLSGSPTPAAVVGLSGEIDDYNRDSFFKRFKQAKADGARTIIVEIDTWGGLVTAGLDISRFLKKQTDVHTIAYVNDRAISAGAMIAMACDEIVMADVATIGDCAPIARAADGSLQSLPTAERAKLQSPIAADFYESAIRNHHDPLLAEAMVVTEVAVYWVQAPGGERRFVNQPDYEKLIADDWKPVEGVPNPVDPADRLLTVHADLAVTLGLASGKAASVEQLAANRNLSIVETLKSGAGEAIIAWLNSGWVRMFLITIFGASIYAAVHAPGHGTAEALSLTTLGLLLGVPLLTGYATWWEILLIVGGLAMVAFEIFVFPHAGIMVVAGALMMLVGLVLTFVGGEPDGSRIMPKLPGTMAALKHGLMFVTAGMVCSAMLSWWISRYLPKIPYFNRLVLTATSGGGPAVATAGGLVPAPQSTWPPVGSVGRAVTPLRPGGSAEFPDPTGADFQIFSVVSESGFLPEGAPVTVREVGGGRVVVRSTTA
jgi:membrane-bound serine protease (ClpP class)